MPKKKRNWFAQRRIELGLSQEEVASELEKAGYSYNRSTISSWENGRHHPPLHDNDFATILAGIFKLSRSGLIEIAFDLKSKTNLFIDANILITLENRRKTDTLVSFAIIHFYDKDMKPIEEAPIVVRVDEIEEEGDNDKDS